MVFQEKIISSQQLRNEKNITCKAARGLPALRGPSRTPPAHEAGRGLRSDEYLSVFQEYLFVFCVFYTGMYKIVPGTFYDDA